MADKTCAHCGAVIRKINYALGEEWMHVNTSFPNERKFTAWRHCHLTTATPEGSDR